MSHCPINSLNLHNNQDSGQIKIMRATSSSRPSGTHKMTSPVTFMTFMIAIVRRVVGL